MQNLLMFTDKFNANIEGIMLSFDDEVPSLHITNNTCLRESIIVVMMIRTLLDFEARSSVK